MDGEFFFRRGAFCACVCLCHRSSYAAQFKQHAQQFHDKRFSLADAREEFPWPLFTNVCVCGIAHMYIFMVDTLESSVNHRRNERIKKSATYKSASISKLERELMESERKR